VRELLQGLRLSDCGLQGPPAWHADARLAAAAAHWAGGLPLRDSIERAGYQAASVNALHFGGLFGPQAVPLSRASCEALADHALVDYGSTILGDQAWLLLAQPRPVPDTRDVPGLARQVLVLVNDARKRGLRCGDRQFPPTSPLFMSATLSIAAQAHAADMASGGYFDHRNRAGQSPGERVRAAGYQEQRVGENIAYGAADAQEVVAGWLRSTGHCKNLMDPRFSDMGVGLATGKGARPGPYWVQDLAEPR
jgi:uncharacterized protein YkwD